MKKVIITGPTGAIGHALIEECIRNQVEVYALCHPGSKRIVGFPSNNLLHVICVDLSRLSDVKNVIPNDVDVFIIWGGWGLLVMLEMTCIFRIVMSYMHWTP